MPMKAGSLSCPRLAGRGWLAAGAALVGMALLGLADTASAQSPAAGQAQGASLEGSWRGGGTVTFFSSGGREQARCRANYSRGPRNSFLLNATCATASARASQTATLQKIGANTYSGTFYNAEYDITGTIYVVLRGDSQNVTLRSAQGSANFQLSRR
jgi:hypothetical protein